MSLIFRQKIYVGSISPPAIKDKVESAKLILSIGSLKSDFNTGNFTYSISPASTVEVGRPLDVLILSPSVQPFLCCSYTPITPACSTLVSLG
jgi:hypothetical protein